VVEGETEKVIGKLFGAALNGEALPRYYNVSASEVPKCEDIPDIVAPSVNGLIEVGRGCCRGCEFCNVTLRPLRWYPIEKILREIDIINWVKLASAAFTEKSLCFTAAQYYTKMRNYYGFMKKLGKK
jgi:radical SAM superfamily enzyme YgiQ (UPF0313 family)